MTEIEQLQQAIATLDAQRAILGDAVVNAALAPMREKLAALQAPAEEQRKQVTVLFADVSGFTALSERMDAEDVGALINAVWGRLDGILQARGGTIDKHIGDEVMALWGVRQAREDDAEQAVRAALELQEQLRALGADSASALQMRIGINTGPVLLGALGTTGEHSAIGDTVNVASRLQNAAPVGGVLISHDTYLHVRGLFELQPQALLPVRGKTELLQTYVVERARPPADRTSARGVEGVRTRMVGREAELRLLQETFDTAVVASRARVVTVVGEPGIGKSRLLAEFVDGLEVRHHPLKILKARATPQTASTPYTLLRDLFAEQFNILDNDPAPVARQKLEEGLSEFLGAESEMKAHFIGTLVGYDFSGSPDLFAVLNDPAQLRSRSWYYLKQLFTAITDRLPTLIILEDIHWSDQSSLEAFDRLAHDLPNARLMILCLTRPTLFEHTPAWGQEQPESVRLDLQPLAPEDSRQLVDDILQKVREVPAALRELIISQAEGNPFYVEELIKVLIDDRVIERDDTTGEWRIEPAKLSALRVPATLTAVLQARLDSLTAAEKTTLQQAAVVGRIFWDGVLKQLQRSGDAPAVALAALCQRELIFPHQPAAFAGVSEYLFKHALLRDVTYESVLKRARQVYHGQVAAWLADETSASGRGDEYAPLIAEHYALAGQAERAVDYLQRAAEHALSVSAFGEVQALSERGLGLLDNGASGADAMRARMILRRLLGDAFQRRGDFPPALAHYEQSLSLARELRDEVTLASVYLGMADITLARGDSAGARAQYQEAFAHSPASSRQHAIAVHGLGLVAEYEGDSASATDYYLQSLAIHWEIGNRLGVAQSLNSLCVIAFAQNDFDTATTYCEESLSMKREIGDRAGISVSLNNLGDIAHRQGNFQAALDYFKQSLAIDHDIGNRRGEAISLGNLVEVYLELGQPEAAGQALRDGLRLTREIAAAPLTLWLLGQAALWRLYTGDPIRAAEWTGLVTHHPLIEPGDREQIERLRARLEAAAGADAVAAAWSRGETLMLDGVVEEILSA